MVSNGEIYGRRLVLDENGHDYEESVAVETDYRDSGEVWLWIDSDHRITLMRADVVDLLEGFRHLEIYEVVQTLMEDAQAEKSS